MQSGLWKYWSIHRSRRTGAASVAGTSLAVLVTAFAALVGTGARSQAEIIPTQTQLSVETTNAAAGMVSTFNIHVTPAGARAAGVVTLVEGDGNGEHQLASTIVDSEGNARIALTSLPSGAHAIRAIFEGGGEGSTELASSHSPVTEVTTEASGIPNFSVTASPTSLSVVQGDEITSILTLTPINGFSGYVTLSCSHLTPDSSCNFVPVNVFVGGTSSSPSTLSVITYGPTGPDAALGSHAHVFYAILIPGILGIFGLGLRGRRVWRHAGMVLMVIAVAAGMGGCSARYHYLNKSPVASPGTPLGSTQFTLEEQSISGVTVITNQTTLALTVKAPS